MNTSLRFAVPLLLLAPGCSPKADSIGDLPADGGAGAGGSEGSSGHDGSSGGPQFQCGEPGYELQCFDDGDKDGVPLCEDNAPDYYNPPQLDSDDDDYANVIDLCPTVAAASNSADSDNDGIGNDCDVCRRATDSYNENAPNFDVPFYMRVRNLPWTGDIDGDGIGDACDNCVAVPNCEDYGGDTPYVVGDPIAFDHEVVCQADSDVDMLGDACDGLMPNPNAAGVVGFGPEDDFDQDGVTNASDACPRIPLADAIDCSGSGSCPDGRECAPSGVCDHRDTDEDDVGDACDTCPAVPNPMQVVGEGGTHEDDEDGDFIGSVCELGPDCGIRREARHTAFYTVSVAGQCCTTTYPGDGQLTDPDGAPIRLACSASDEANGVCRGLPAHVAKHPGVFDLPPGCPEALAAAGLTAQTNVPLNPEEFTNPGEVYQFACTLPPRDQDFDGLGDLCDLCPHAFDPNNEVFVDNSGRLWPDRGRYCSGDYELENCAD